MEQIFLEKSGTEIRLSRGLRFLVFFVLLSLSVVISGDNGVISSCSEEIKSNLDLSEKEYGVFSSFTVVGRIIGSLLFMFILSFYENRKTVTVVTIFSGGFLLLVYCVTANKYILYIVRLGTGIIKIYPHIFNGMWVNQFGFQRYKTIMITIIKSAPLGQGFGYIVGTLIPEGRYAIGFFIVSMCIMLLGLIIMFCPKKYLMAKYYFVGYIDNNKLVKKSTPRTSCSYFRKINTKEIKQTQGIILNVFCNKAYLSAIFIGANLGFIFQVIHLNIKSYCQQGLGVSRKQKY